MKIISGAHVEKKEIRLQYSGFVVFAAKLISIATGLFFAFMVARATTGPEYDIWFNINDILGYFTLLAGVVPFWVMRCVARGNEGATKTGFATNLVISAISTIAYLAAVPFILNALGIAPHYLTLYLIVSVQIVELYIMNSIESCLQATVPQTIGYGLLLQQVFKVILGYVLIIQLGQPLIGAVISTSIALVVQLAYYYKLTAPEFKQRIRWSYAKEWLKGSVASIYNVIGNQVASLVFIMLFALGGTGARSIYGAAGIIASVITYSGFLAFALYPKLLAEKNREDVTLSLKMVLMFALPMAVGAIVMASSFLVVLRPDFLTSYPGSEWVLIALSLDALVTVVSGIYGSVLFGVETVDQNETISFRKLMKSKMFIFFSLPYVHSAVTIPTTYYVLTTYATNQPLQAALSVTIINTTMRFAMFIVLYVLVRKMMRIDIPWKSIAKYLFASAVMGAVLFLLPQSEKVSTTLIYTAVAGVVYLAVLLAIDKEARDLPMSILREVRGKKNQSSTAS